MKVQCDQPVSVNVNVPAKAQQPPTKHARSKAPSRKTRVTSCACPAAPILESEEEALNVSVTSNEASDIKADVTSVEASGIKVDVTSDIKADPPVASEDDFPPDHWIEPTSDNMPLCIPSPTPVTNHISLPSASVNAMDLGNEIVLARVDAMEKDFEMYISSMHVEVSGVQHQLAITVLSIDGLVNMVKKLQQAHAATNPLFPAPLISNLGATMATTQVQAMGMQYLNGIYGPSGNTFTSGQATSISALAGPSSTPAGVGPHFDMLSPTSATCSV
ncbi:uncharacterized protein BJ212DRAFT_1480941 [Suillus subaureus]|uniref:Uncharacterized protein n=1 Tax=Suillus subaureus TaxID=48587 RepID=A0A9P7EBT3_9AGAM|nr:uncharacterized protein BJ212DRAFT_1480941 [Suillus subaureus]KAG1816499.1 hypothetical protein BJ212DRAFT_1480941 [Suillus subaureus]